MGLARVTIKILKAFVPQVKLHQLKGVAHDSVACGSMHAMRFYLLPCRKDRQTK